MRRIDRGNVPTIKITFEGIPISAFADDSVAAALLAAGQAIFRTTPVSGSNRGPLCMMGACFDCLVEIDGVGNQQACMIEVREGMVIRRQVGAVDISGPLNSSHHNEATS